jgi:hypothetical protein
MSTQSSSWDNARIHAYVDGALDSETAARLEADSRHDAALAARIAQQRELSARLRATYDPVLEEPIPQRLRDTLVGSNPYAAITPIGAARKAPPRRSWSLREWGALAAAVVLGAVLGPFIFRDSTELPIANEGGRLVAGGYLDAALSTQIAGTTAEGALARIELSFRATDGDYCRVFALRAGPGGVACRREGRWAVEIMDGGGTPTSEPGGFRQASSALTPAILSAMTTLGASEALTPDEERQRLGSGWDAAATVPP